MNRDPVCNMEVSHDAITQECDGVAYYFCSEGCREKFLKDRECRVSRLPYDLIIIGSGPAGLTAAVYASMLRMDAFLIGRDLGGQAIDSTKIENYMGFDFINGPELIEKFQHQLIHSHYIDHLVSEVERIEPDDAGFRVITSDSNAYSAKTLIVATGMTRRRINVSGEEEFQRRGVFYGNLQDLSFVQGENVAVIGGGNSALQMVENLGTVAKKIYLVSDSRLKADPLNIERVKLFKNLRIYEEHLVVEFAGTASLSGIAIRRGNDGEIITIPVKGVFIAIGSEANSALVSDLVDLNKRGEIVIKSDCSTSCPGIFAAGDVTDVFGKRIIIACGEGAKAAMAARQYLLSRKE